MSKNLRIFSKPPLDQKREDIFRHYYTCYDLPLLPPSWMISEVLSLGTWSLIFDCLALKEDKKDIAREFHLHPTILQSWLHSLTFLRNLCAHHLRIWNRKFKIAPIEMKKYKKYFQPNFSFYAQFSMLHILSVVVSNNNHWSQKLHNLFLQYPSINQALMGFPKRWYKDLFWQLNIRELMSNETLFI